MPTRRSILALLLLALVIAAPSASARSHDDVIFFRDVGSPGANGAFVLSSDTPNAVVVFLHGWRDVGTGPYYDWLQSLAFSGAAVIFPRYQSSSGGSPAKTLPALRAGIEAGLATLRKPSVPVIVAGYDYGARLAFYYAANARRWGLPAPFAIDSIFPTTARTGLPALGAIPGATRVLLQLEANERPAASDLVHKLAGRAAARTHVRIVHASGGHRAPLADTAAARAAFWPSLDALLGQAVQTG